MSAFVHDLSPTGAPLYGDMSADGIGELAEELERVPDLDLQKGRCRASNLELIRSVVEDKHSDALHELTLQDARCHRMTQPVPVADLDLDAARLAPRFAVEQGFRDDGSIKVRAVDHMSWSAAGVCGRKRSRSETKKGSINGHSNIPIRIRHDHLDALASIMRKWWLLLGILPALWKTDIDAAFRRIPVCDAHAWAAGTTSSCPQWGFVFMRACFVRGCL